METIDALGFAKEQVYDRVVSCTYEDWDTAENWDINHNLIRLPLTVRQIGKISRVTITFIAKLGIQDLMEFFTDHIGDIDDKENCLRIVLSNDSMATITIAAKDISPEKVHIEMTNEGAAYTVDFISKRVTTLIETDNDKVEYFRKRE